MNDYLNALMSLQLPFALLPTLTFTSSHKVMGDFRNGWLNKLVASILSLLVIGINLRLVSHVVLKKFPSDAAVWKLVLLYLATGLFVVYYLIFVLYLVSLLTN